MNLLPYVISKLEKDKLIDAFLKDFLEKNKIELFIDNVDYFIFRKPVEKCFYIENKKIKRSSDSGERLLNAVKEMELALLDAGRFPESKLNETGSIEEFFHNLDVGYSDPDIFKICKKSYDEERVASDVYVDGIFKIMLDDLYRKAHAMKVIKPQEQQFRSEKNPSKIKERYYLSVILLIYYEIFKDYPLPLNTEKDKVSGSYKVRKSAFYQLMNTVGVELGLNFGDRIIGSGKCYVKELLEYNFNNYGLADSIDFSTIDGIPSWSEILKFPKYLYNDCPSELIPVPD